MSQVIKPKPGIYNGVRYRSQLEISWAKWFDEVGLDWKYIDTSEHDFDVQKFGCIEVKPRNADMIYSASTRIWEGDDGQQIIAKLLIGSPPSIYGNGLLLHVILIHESCLLLAWISFDLKDKRIRYFDPGWSYVSHDAFSEFVTSVVLKEDGV